VRSGRSIGIKALDVVGHQNSSGWAEARFIFFNQSNGFQIERPADAHRVIQPTAASSCFFELLFDFLRRDMNQETQRTQNFRPPNGVALRRGQRCRNHRHRVRGARSRQDSVVTIEDEATRS
jgi:hypothetical protein